MRKLRWADIIEPPLTALRKTDRGLRTDTGNNAFDAIDSSCWLKDVLNSGWPVNTIRYNRDR